MMKGAQTSSQQVVSPGRLKPNEGQSADPAAAVETKDRKLLRLRVVMGRPPQSLVRCRNNRTRAKGNFAWVM